MLPCVSLPGPTQYNSCSHGMISPFCESAVKLQRTIKSYPPTAPISNADLTFIFRFIQCTDVVGWLSLVSLWKLFWTDNWSLVKLSTLYPKVLKTIMLVQTLKSSYVDGLLILCERERMLTFCRTDNVEELIQSVCLSVSLSVCSCVYVWT